MAFIVKSYIFPTIMGLRYNSLEQVLGHPFVLSIFPTSNFWT